MASRMILCLWHGSISAPPESTVPLGVTTLSRVARQGRRCTMADMHTRIDQLAPERRKLLEHMLAPRRPVPVAATHELPAASLSVAAVEGDEDVKAACRRMYDAINNQLDAGMFGAFSFFLNYGYVPDLSPQYATLTVPEHYLNRNS